MIEFRCAQCGAEMSVPQCLAGQTEACPECRKVNQIPVEEPPAITDAPKEVLRGACEVCGKAPRSLRKTETRQMVCRTCYLKCHPPRPKHLASLVDVASMRDAGFKVSDDLTKTECKRLKMVSRLREKGYDVPENTPLEELEQLSADHWEEMGSGEKSALQWKYFKGCRINTGNERVSHFFTKLVGVTFQNDDGSDRQTIISECSPFEVLQMDHEEDNPHDPNAVRVCTQGGQQLGHLSRELAVEVIDKSKKGFGFALIILEITGGTRNQPTRGVNVIVVVAEPGVPDQEGQEYLDSITPEILADLRSTASDDEY